MFTEFSTPIPGHPKLSSFTSSFPVYNIPRAVNMSSSPRVAIIGAGPAGLCLGRLLQRDSVHVAIFEKETSSDHRKGLGGSLDLHVGTGQAAIEAAGLWDEYQKLARYNGQHYIISDDTGHQALNMKEDLGRPEIDRPQLRQILLDSLEEGTIRWAHKLTRVDEDRTLYFETPEDKNKVETGFDLVVGADGAWSKVRPLLSTMPPVYSGFAGYETWITDPDHKCPAVSEMIGEGTHLAFGQDGRGFLMQRQSDRRVQMYGFMRKPQDWLETNGVLDHTDREQVRAYQLQEYAKWWPGLKAAIEAADGPVKPRSLYMLHVGTRWTHKRGFTLIGDAAHLMTPFAGEGVNVALHDSLLLAKEIVGNFEDMDAAVDKYEKDMFPRAEAFQQVTWNSMRDRFEPDGNQKIKKAFTRVAEDMKAGKTIKDGSRPDGLWDE
jgi:2-polyprenyl-6-methoxyphenol hydroxylase-like FAD-dependent oxidoreductase